MKPLEDPHGLLKSAREKKSKPRTLSVLQERFLEIVSFYDREGRIPELTSRNPLEAQLGARFVKIVGDSRLKGQLLDLDSQHKILEIDTFESALKDRGVPAYVNRNDPFDLLRLKPSREIHRLRHVNASERIQPDYLAKRIRCLNFDDYQPLFRGVHSAMESGTVRIKDFDAEKLGSGDFFILNGILGLLVSQEIEEKNYQYASGERTRTDGRTRCVFENGTEADLTRRSLVKALQRDGYIFTEAILEKSEIDGFQISAGNTGFVYVLQSERQDVSYLPNLFKIGFTSGTVASRLGKASSEATYLFARVKVVATYKCINLDSRQLEKLLHSFFAQRRLQVRLKNSDGFSFKPREWFQVPFALIDEAIGLVMKGQLLAHRYDSDLEEIVRL